MVNLPQRRTDDLHKGRVSLAGARYFVTCTIEGRIPLLCECTTAVRSVLARLVDDGDAVVLCGIVMPDHLHILVVLEGSLSIGQVVGKLKALTRPALTDSGIRWQRDFFEHHLRPGENANSYARYMFLNPYRAQLIDRSECWSYWFCDDMSRFDFSSLLDKGQRPPAEWLEYDLGDLGLEQSNVGE